MTDERKQVLDMDVNDIMDTIVGEVFSLFCEHPDAKTEIKNKLMTEFERMIDCMSMV